MASGSYHPASGSTGRDSPRRTAAFVRWGVPTVEDRVAQTVVKEVLEPELEKNFHPGPPTATDRGNRRTSGTGASARALLAK